MPSVDEVQNRLLGAEGDPSLCLAAYRDFADLLAKGSVEPGDARRLLPLCIPHPPPSLFQSQRLPAESAGRFHGFLVAACAGLDVTRSALRVCNSQDLAKPHAVGSLVLRLCGFMECEGFAAPWCSSSTHARAVMCLEGFPGDIPVDDEDMRKAADSVATRFLDDSQRRSNLLLLAACPAAMRHSRTLLSHTLQTEQSSDISTSDSGPSSVARSAMAHAVLAFTQQLRHPFLSAAVPHLLPVVVAAYADPSPAVQHAAALMLTHIAAHSTAASIYHQRDILLHASTRVMVAVEPSAWSASLGAAWALAGRVDSIAGGLDARARVFEATLAEVRRQGHIRTFRKPFLSLLAAERGAGLLGWQLLAHSAQLMPMLLDWVRDAEDDGLAEACEALLAWAGATWPRSAAHAPVVLAELQQLQQRDSLNPGSWHDARHDTPDGEPGRPAHQKAALSRAVSVFEAMASSEPV